MQQVILLRVILLLVVPLNSVASQFADFCPDLFRITQQVKTCSFNPAFSAAALACTAAMEKRRAEKTAQLTALLAATNKATGAGQDKEFSSHAKNLADATASLQALERNAVQARAQMQDYLDNLMRPGKISPQLAKQLHAPFLGWLEKFSCYKQNREQITGEIGKMTATIASLGQTLGQVGVMAGGTSGSLTNLKNEGTIAQPIVKGVSGASAPSVPSRGTSSISGADENEAKRKKSEQLGL